MQLAPEDSNVSTMTMPAPKQSHTFRTNQELKKSMEQNGIIAGNIFEKLENVEKLEFSW